MAQVLEALNALKAASRDIEANSKSSNSENSPSMKALLELETDSVSLFSGDPHLSVLSSLLSRLKSIASSSLRRHQTKELSSVAGSIGSELQSWIDRRSIHRLMSPSSSDEERICILSVLESRLSQGFDRAFQDLLLRSGVFSVAEALLADPNSAKSVRDRSASVILAFVRFNKDVFVGEVLMGPTVGSLVSIASPTSIRVLNGLIALIRSPLVDELHSGGEIVKIVNLLRSECREIEIRVLAFDTVLEIGYYGRKEAIDDMVQLGVVEILVEIQRSEIGGSMIDEDDDDDGGGVRVGGVGREKGWRRRPFASCVWRFAVQMEVGEGLRQRERREMKLEVVRRVRKAAKDAAEEAAIVAEVLWGSNCW